MINLMLVFGLIAIGVVIFSVLTSILNHYVFKYHIELLKIENSKIMSFLSTMIVILIIVVLYYILEKNSFSVITQQTDILAIYSLIFGILAIYAIIFSISQVTIGSNIEHNSYLGIYIDDRPYKMIVLESWEQSFIFKVILLYFITFPLFISLNTSDINLLVLWHVSFLLVLVTTIFTLVWGYETMKISNYTKINNRRFQAKIIIENSILYWLYSDLKKDIFTFRTRKYSDSVKSYINSISDSEVAYFIDLTFSRANFQLQIWFSSYESEKFSKRIKNFFIERRKKHIKEDSVWYFMNDFWRDIKAKELIKPELISEDNYPLLYANSLRTFEILSSDKIFLQKIVMNREFSCTPSVRNIGIYNSSVLFPEVVLLRSSKNIDYWISVNSYLGRYLPRIIDSLVDGDKNIVFSKDLYRYRRNYKELSFEEKIATSLSNIIIHQLKMIKLVDDEFEDLFSRNPYNNFISSLIDIYPEYSIQLLKFYIENPEKCNYFLSENQLNIISHEINEQKCLLI